MVKGNKAPSLPPKEVKVDLFELAFQEYQRRRRRKANRDAFATALRLALLVAALLIILSEFLPK